MTSAIEDEPKGFEQHLAELKTLAANGAGGWAMEKDENDGQRIKPADLAFTEGFLEQHFEAIK
jgi:hypothetical protein